MEEYWKEIERLNNQMAITLQMARESDDNEVQAKLVNMHYKLMKQKKQLMIDEGRRVAQNVRA